jgi:hypothetical protein
MLTLDAKLLEIRELPGSDPFPPSCLLTVLAGSQTLNLVGRHELLKELEGFDAFDDLRLELKWRVVDLQSLGGTGKGKAYRLSVRSVQA